MMNVYMELLKTPLSSSPVFLFNQRISFISSIVMNEISTTVMIKLTADLNDYPYFVIVTVFQLGSLKTEISLSFITTP